MLRTYTLANGASVDFYDSDFDYIVNYGEHGFKRLKTVNCWFNGETRKEVTDLNFIRLLNLMCVDGNANCYRNLTFPGYEFVPKGERCNGKLMKNAELSYVPAIIKIIVNDKTTIVLWEDGTKTIVRPSANDNYDLEAAVCAAIAKKIYGTNSAFKRMIKEKTKVQVNKKKEIDPILKTLRCFLYSTKPSHVENDDSASTKGEEDE